MKLFLLLACAAVSVLMEVSNSNSNSNTNFNSNSNSNTNSNSNSNSNSMFDTTLDEGWKSWKSFHRKQYKENNENYRRMVWEENLKFIAKHNLEHSMGKHTFTVAMNQFGDLTMKEFAQRLNKFNQKKVGNMTDKLFTAQENTHLPSFVDWRPKGYVTPVKDQGQCGSCWAFSTTGVLEGQVFKKTGKLISLSEQYLMDCSRDAGNHGCNGGYKVQSLLFIKEKGICSEDSYPYTARNGECKSNRNDIVATCKGVRKIPTNSERDLAAAVATVGPISVSIDAEHRAFMLYKSGIFYEPHCSPAKLDHEVLAVGYGTEDQKPYWIVKNSWGTSWGMEGYVHMSKDMDNNCGIATDAIYPEV